ncbi:MAG: hypothetical protein H6624_12045 [Bdellovibrionaceae bacterium]|nr:hypothetical protein [Bdellovibrionales bacterium]MCB9085073.1 hypothetical protein [Pseudobdellovibrionaceae bacterium]
MKYSDALSKLYSRIIMPKTAPGIEKVQRGLERLALPLSKAASRTLVVAGTNGKGSVCRTLEHFMAKAGLKTHLFTSPHLVHVQERIRIGEKCISEEDFTTAFSHVDQLTQDLDLSHFETLVLVAAWLFYQDPPGPEDWFIWEVGLGGTWDATNAIPHEHSVVTALGFDHQDLLGNTITDIAKNKFGIFSANQNVYCLSDYPSDVQSLLSQKIEKLYLNVHLAPPWSYQASPDFPLPIEILHCQWGTIKLPQPGRHFAENLNLSLCILDHLGIDLTFGMRALEQLYWPGRMDMLQPLATSGTLILSGDHNPLGAQMLGKTLSSVTYDRVALLVGMGKGKDRKAVLQELANIPRSQLTLTHSPFQGCEAGEFSHWLKDGCEYVRDPWQALTTLLDKCGPRDLVVVTGSLYLVGKIYSHALRANWLPLKKRGFFI